MIGLATGFSSSYGPTRIRTWDQPVMSRSLRPTALWAPPSAQTDATYHDTGTSDRVGRMTDRAIEEAGTGERPVEPTRLRFDDLPLPDAVREGIRAAGFEYCTGIQAKVLPLSLAGKDV